MHGLRRVSSDGFKPRESFLLVLLGQRISCSGSCSRREDRPRTLLGANGFVHCCTLAARVTNLNAIAVRVVLSVTGHVHCAATHWRRSAIQIND